MVAILAVSAVALIAMGAFVMDVGAWIRAHRATQSAADASALAAAQALPISTTTASTLGLTYAGKNGGGVVAGDIVYSTYSVANDTVSVTARRTAPGFLSRVVGVSTVNLKATAVARAYNLGAARYAAPFGISKNDPFLSGGGCPCFGQQTSFDLNKVGPGGFEVINIDGSQGGLGQTTLAGWINDGFSGAMPLGWYSSDPGAKFNASEVQSAMDARVGSELLFPVYDMTRSNGSNMQYRVIGWAGFFVTGWQAQGNGATISGYLKQVAWEGLEATSFTNYFGATVVKLVG